MNNFENVYQTEENIINVGRIQFYFISKGSKDVIKAIQYQYVRHFENLPLFNLGFGDFNPQTGMVSDEEISNNGDAYKVFHTVLNTVPRLFSICGNITLMVQGSDSKSEFIEILRKASEMMPFLLVIWPKTGGTKMKHGVDANNLSP